MKFDIVASHVNNPKIIYYTAEWDESSGELKYKSESAPWCTYSSPLKTKDAVRSAFGEGTKLTFTPREGQIEFGLE